VRVVVTGAAGFIGRRLVSRLADEGREVYAMDARPLLPLPAGVRVAGADLRDPGAAGVIRALRPDRVVHLAGMSQLGACEQDPRAAFEHNVTATANVVRGLGSAGLVLASSAHVYGPRGDPAREEDEPLPAGVYGVTKVLAEELARLHARRTGGPTRVLRLANVYGPGDASGRVLPSILRQLRTREPAVRLGALEARRDFVYVDDVVELILAAMDGRPGGGALDVVNVGTGTLHTIGELLAHVLAAAGRSPRIDAAPPALSPPPDPPRLDVSRMREMLGTVEITSLRDGIARTLAEEGLLDG
jgi:UDP-glucose 4-epimerase